MANSETSIFSVESRHKSISTIPNKPIKLNKRNIKNNPTSQYQSSSLNNQNHSIHRQRTTKIKVHHHQE